MATEFCRDSRQRRAPRPIARESDVENAFVVCSFLLSLPDICADMHRVSESFRFIIHLLYPRTAHGTAPTTHFFAAEPACPFETVSVCDRKTVRRNVADRRSISRRASQRWTPGRERVHGAEVTPRRARARACSDQLRRESRAHKGSDAHDARGILHEGGRWRAGGCARASQSSL